VANATTLSIGGTSISSTAAELNLLDASTTSAVDEGDWAIVQRVAKGSIGASQHTVGLHGLGATLPDNSIVTKVVIDCTTTFVGADVEPEETASELILALYDGITVLNTLVEATTVENIGAQSVPYKSGLTDLTSTLAAFKLTAAGELKLSVSALPPNGALTAGVADIYIYYIIGA
jgi:hypothetical protein